MSSTRTTQSTYCLERVGFDAAVRPRLLRQFAAAFVMIELLLILAFMGPGVFHGHLGLSAGMLCAALVALMVLATLTTLLFGQRLDRQRLEWDRFRLQVDDERVTVRVANGASTVLRRSGITRIVEQVGAGLFLCGAGNRRVSVAIPLQVRGYDDVRARLATWMPIEVVPRRQPAGSLLLLAAGILAGCVGTAVLVNIHAAMMAGLGVIAFGATAMSRLMASPTLCAGGRVLACALVGVLMLAPFVRLVLFFASLPR